MGAWDGTRSDWRAGGVASGLWGVLVAGLIAQVGCGGGPALRDSASVEGNVSAEDAGSSADGSETEPDAVTGLDGGCVVPMVTDRGSLTFGDALADVTLEACAVHRYSVAASKGSEIVAEVQAVAGGALAAAFVYPDGTDEVLANVEAPADRRVVRLTLAVPRSGEILLRLAGEDPASEHRYSVVLSCAGECPGETTRFPIVLVHGWTGWNSIGPYEYFFGVPGKLEEAGYLVYVASLDPYNSVEVRSEQLASQIDGFLAEARARKVNLIAHSQGGLDSRRLITTLGYGDRVGALVTVATPHHGTPLCDIALGYMPGPAMDVLAWLLELLGAAGGNESDAKASFHALSQHYVEGEFNPQTPDDPRVTYVSYTGRTCTVFEECGDTCDAEILASYWILSDAAGENDGIVPVASAPWGDFRGVVPADHFDEIGQLAGVTNPNFDHREFYLGLVRDLAAEKF